MLLPHTTGCLACGRDNPIGLHVRLSVWPDTGRVTTDFTPGEHHVGFVGLIHGGLLATVVDEAMVWTSIWSSKRACVAAELTIRFKQKAAVGRPLTIESWVTRARRRLIETESAVTDGPVVVCTATAKYVPLDEAATADFVRTFVDDPETAEATRSFQSGVAPEPGV